MQVSRQQELAHLFSVFFLTTAQLFSALSFKILVAFWAAKWLQDEWVVMEDRRNKISVGKLNP